MKEIVDRILAGSVVDIAKDGGDYYLNVLKDGNKYKIGFMSSLHNKEYGSRLTVEMIKEAVERLIALSDELNARKKFKNGDKYFTVRPNGKIIDWYFDSSESGDMAFYADGDGTFRPKFGFDIDVPDVAIIGGALIPFCKCGVILKNKVAFCHKCSQRLIWTAGEKN